MGDHDHHAAMTTTQLDQMHCSTPGCDHAAHDGLFFHSACHPGAAVEAEYRSGRIHLRCNSCKSPVAVVAVAP